MKSSGGGGLVGWVINVDRREKLINLGGLVVK